MQVFITALGIGFLTIAILRIMFQEKVVITEKVLFIPQRHLFFVAVCIYALTFILPLVFGNEKPNFTIIPIQESERADSIAHFRLTNIDTDLLKIESDEESTFIYRFTNDKEYRPLFFTILNWYIKTLAPLTNIIMALAIIVMLFFRQVVSSRFLKILTYLLFAALLIVAVNNRGLLIAPISLKYKIFQSINIFMWLVALYLMYRSVAFEYLLNINEKNLQYAFRPTYMIGLVTLLAFYLICFIHSKVYDLEDLPKYLHRIERPERLPDAEHRVEKYKRKYQEDSEKN